MEKGHARARVSIMRAWYYANATAMAFCLLAVVATPRWRRCQGKPRMNGRYEDSPRDSRPRSSAKENLNSIFSFFFCEAAYKRGVSKNEQRSGSTGLAMNTRLTRYMISEREEKKNLEDDRLTRWVASKSRKHVTHQARPIAANSRYTHIRLWKMKRATE